MIKKLFFYIFIIVVVLYYLNSNGFIRFTDKAKDTLDKKVEGLKKSTSDGIKSAIKKSAELTKEAIEEMEEGEP